MFFAVVPCAYPKANLRWSWRLRKGAMLYSFWRFSHELFGSKFLKFFTNSWLVVIKRRRRNAQSVADLVRLVEGRNHQEDEVLRQIILRNPILVLIDEEKKKTNTRTKSKSNEKQQIPNIAYSLIFLLIELSWLYTAMWNWEILLMTSVSYFKTCIFETRE